MFKKLMKWTGIGCGGFIAFVFVAGIIGTMFSPGGPFGRELTAAEKTEREARAVEAEKESAQREADAELDSQRRALARMAKTEITQSLRNPDSVVFEYVGVNNDATLVCVNYRAQNGFGGMNRESVAIDKNGGHTSAAFWNKHCVKLYQY